MKVSDESKKQAAINQCRADNGNDATQAKNAHNRKTGRMHGSPL